MEKPTDLNGLYFIHFDCIFSDEERPKLLRTDGWTRRQPQFFQYDNELGFSLKPNVIYKNPTQPLENAPRRIMFGDMRTEKNGFLFTEDLDLLGKTPKAYFRNNT